MNSEEKVNPAFAPDGTPAYAPPFYEPNIPQQVILNPAQQQQQPSVIYVNNPAPQVIVQPVLIRRPYSAAIAMSCFVIWFCGCLFGFVAFCFALGARSKKLEGRDKEAQQLAIASYVLSAIGVVTGIFLIIFLSVWMTGNCYYVGYYLYCY